MERERVSVEKANNHTTFEGLPVRVWRSSARRSARPRGPRLHEGGGPMGLGPYEFSLMFVMFHQCLTHF